MKNLRITALTALLACTAVLTGCKTDKTAQPDVITSDISAVSESETAETEEIFAAHPTYDELISAEIFGKPVALPFAVSDLGDDFRIDTSDNGLEFLCRGNDVLSSIDTDGDQNILSFCLSAEDGDIKLSRLTVSVSTTEDDILAAWGDPDKKESDGTLYYFDSNGTYDASVRITFEDGTADNVLCAVEETEHETYPDGVVGGEFYDFDKLEINGKTVHLPFDASELGDDFTVGPEEGTLLTRLFYKNRRFAIIDTDENSDTYIRSILISVTDLEFSVGGITFNADTTEEDIISEWGNPERDEINDLDVLIYSSDFDPNFKVMVNFFEGSIDSVELGFDL